jgi:hypothetical protein
MTLVAGSGRAVHVQSPQAAPAAVPSEPTLLTNAPLTHLGIVCRDLVQVTKGYADLFGIPVPEISRMSFDLPNGKKATAKVAYVSMPNFYLELLQPVTESGPIYDHLQRYGLGVHHLGVGVDGDVDAVVAELVSKDGKRTGGRNGGTQAFVDFRHTELGTTLEVGPTMRPVMPAAPTTQTGLFGGQAIRHVGLANLDIEASMQKYIEVFGMKAMPVRRFPPEGWFPYPPGHKWSKTSYVLTNQLTQVGINIELIMSVASPTPWTHHIDKQQMTSIMHIAVGMGKIPRDEWLRIGQEKGGKWTNGGADSFFAYLDWSDTLGLVIE